MWLYQIWHPERYHGARARAPFFEGWYYKMVSADGRHALAVIPGVHLARNAADSHAFVQVLNSTTGHAHYLRYPLDQMSAADDRLSVRIGDNLFARQSLTLDLVTPETTLQGTLHFADQEPWPVTWRTPGVMGWFAYVPLMQCYHGVLSMDHAIEGKLIIDGESVGWNGGRGYMEKDWGQRFPEAWVWMQSNHFGQRGTSLTASVATIPWLGRSFVGFIVGLLHQGRLYRFATYTGARIESLSVSQDRIHWCMRQPGYCGKAGYRLEIEANHAETSALRGPELEGMSMRVPESLAGTVHVCLQEIRRGRQRTLYEGTGHHAGIEVVGSIEALA